MIELELVAFVALRIAAAQPHGALPFDPRHRFDQRCPHFVALDPPNLQRNPVSASLYLDVPLHANATVDDCARACCGDWSCEAFTFTEAAAVRGLLAGSWFNHDSSVGVHRLAITQSAHNLLVQSIDVAGNNWIGEIGSGRIGWLCFAGDSARNRSFHLADDNNTFFFGPLPTDKKGYSQNFTRAEEPFPGGCIPGAPCCSFRDDSFDALAPSVFGVRSGVRSKLPSYAPPYPQSSTIVSATVDPTFLVGINGDEFPITWGRDGQQYTGAGDNTQANGGGSPLSFFKVQGGPTEMACASPPARPGYTPSPTCANITLQGKEVVVGPGHSVCPGWDGGSTPNLKSSGVLSVEGVLYVRSNPPPPPPPLSNRYSAREH